MATLALAAAGSPVGQQILWGIAFQQAAQLLGPKPPSPKVGDIQISTAEEGADVTMVMGPEVRSGLECIWKSAVRPVPTDQSGACGMGPSVPATYGYFCDLAIAIGQPPPGSVIERVDKIFLDGKVGWTFNPDITIVSTLLSVAVDDLAGLTAQVTNVANLTPIVVTTATPTLIRNFGLCQVSGVNGCTAANGTFQARNVDYPNFSLYDIATGNPIAGNGAWTGGGIASGITRRMRIQSPNGGPDLSVFQPGHDVVVTGFSNSANNGTFSCISASKDATTGISRLILDNPAPVAEAAGSSVTLFQDLPQFSGRQFATITLHNGSQWQQPDSLIQAALTPGAAQGYVGIAYLVFTDFNLTLFGDRVPNVNTLTRCSSTWTVGDTIGAILQRQGYDPSEYDVSALTGTCRGYSIRGVVSGASAMSSIMLTFGVVAYVDGEVIRFVYRKDIVAQTVTSAQLVAHQPGADAPRKSRVRPQRDRDIPREVQVTYQNPSRDYQGGTETAKRMGVRGDVVTTLDTGVTMSPGPAQDLSRRLLWTGYANRHYLEVQLPPSLIRVHEGSAISFTDLGRTWNMLVDRVQYQRDGTLVVSGPNDEAATLDFQSSPADGGAPDSGGPGVLQALDVVPIDLAPLSDAQVQTPGLYLGIAPRRRDGAWVGATLFESTQDADGTFTSTLNVPNASTIGATSGALGGGVLPGMIDYRNTIDVVVSYGTAPESTTLANMLGGKNRAMIGGEVIGFTTVTLVSTDTYRLGGGLLRGLRDTDTMIGTHQSSERVVFLTPSFRVLFVPEAIALLNVDRFFRAVPTSGNVDDYPSAVDSFQANTVRPFSVFDVRAFRDPTDATPDVVLTWQRQTRSNVSVFNPTPIPLNESVEAYDVALMNPNQTAESVVHHVTAVRTTTFTDAEVTGAGYASGAAINVWVYQIGDQVGRGRVRRSTV